MKIRELPSDLYCLCGICPSDDDHRPRWQVRVLFLVNQIQQCLAGATIRHNVNQHGSSLNGDLRTLDSTAVQGADGKLGSEWGGFFSCAGRAPQKLTEEQSQCRKASCRIHVPHLNL